MTSTISQLAAEENTSRLVEKTAGAIGVPARDLHVQLLLHLPRLGAANQPPDSGLLELEAKRLAQLMHGDVAL